MAKFVKSEKDVSLRSSQGTVELLQSITPMDMAQSVPFLKITQVNSKTGAPIENAAPLNAFFQKPPQFGSAISDSTRFGERPPASIEQFTVRTRQNYGIFILEEVEMQIVVHRPDAIFGDDDVWTSLITPGKSHLVEYGWTGTSKNGLINGDGVDDKGSTGTRTTIVPAKKVILFTTYYYTFNIRHTGEIEITVKGWQNGDYLLRQMKLKSKDLEERQQVEGDVSKAELRDNRTNQEIRAAISTVLSDKKTLNVKRYKKRKETVSLLDVLNVFTASTIERSSKLWGYDDVELLVGDFNDQVPASSAKYGGKRISSIGDFEIPLFDVMNIINKSFAKGTEAEMKDIIHSFISLANRSEAWSIPAVVINRRHEVLFQEKIPNLMVRVSDTKVSVPGQGTPKRVMRVVIFDQLRDFVRYSALGLGVGSKTNLSKEEIRGRLLNANIPLIELGNALSFIQDASFEVELDNDIQRVLISAAAQKIKDRSEITEKTDAEANKDLPDKFHFVWASAIKGSLTMLGNFAFDAFSYIWLDFGVPIWNGGFNVRQREDTITAAGFETKLEVKSEGSDPFNVRKTKAMLDNAISEQKKLDDARRKRRGRRARKGGKKNPA